LNLKLVIILVLCVLAASTLACRSRGVDVTIRNDGQTAIHNLEFDYPGAAFGVGSLAPGSSFKYRVKPLSQGEVTLSFEQADGKTFKQKGPIVVPNQDSHLLLIVDQDRTAQWHMRVEQP